MILKQTALKTLLFSGMLISQTIFGAVQNPGSSTLAQPQPQQQIIQQASPQPQEAQDEYAFKKGFRNIHNTTALGYYLLMYFYAGFNGATSEVFKAGLLTPLPSTTAPFALEAIDFVGNEIEDKHKDTFEWFFENSNRFGTIMGLYANSLAIEEANKNKRIWEEEIPNMSKERLILQLLNFLDTDLSDFQKGIPSAIRNVIKTLLRGVIAVAAKEDQPEPNAGCIFEPVYPLLFDGIVSQLPEEAKNSTTKKRLIRGARGLIRAAVRAALYSTPSSSSGRAVSVGRFTGKPTNTYTYSTFADDDDDY